MPWKLFTKHPNNPPLQPGDKAPDFALPSQTGQIVRLSDFRGKNYVVLYFYPKDNTPVCLAETVTFRERYKQFQDHGAVVMGVSSDSVESHRKFACRLHLTFPLLSDAKSKIREAYHVPKTLGLIPGRTTFLIDKNGIIRYSHTSQLNFDSHVELTLKKLKEEVHHEPDTNRNEGAEIGGYRS